MTPALTAPMAAREGSASTPTWNSATTSRNMGGRITACAWLTAWAIDRSQSDRSGWMPSGRATGAVTSRREAWPEERPAGGLQADQADERMRPPEGEVQ